MNKIKNNFPENHLENGYKSNLPDGNCYCREVEEDDVSDNKHILCNGVLSSDVIINKKKKRRGGKDEKK